MIEVGVGLRSTHYEEAMSPSSIDFVEVHAENFFAEGGATQDLLIEVTKHFKLSLHGTSLGLGSLEPPPLKHLLKMKRLIEHCSPFLISDHASFSWVSDHNLPMHAGDLLPIRFNLETLEAMTNNIKRAQDVFGQQILLENISYYVTHDDSPIPEAEFFNQLCQASGCGMLLDIHNVFVNAINKQSEAPLNDVLAFISHLDENYVKEIHLAGIEDTTQPIWIDDHSGPVSSESWIAYSSAIKRFGYTPTLIEWDTQLPPWSKLISEAMTAASHAKRVLNNG